MKIINLIFISLLISFAKPSVRLISPHLLINRDYFNDSSSPILKSETLFRYLEDVQGSNYANLKTVRLYGDSTLGYYYINLFFGSNYHKASLIVDTGSTITAIPCRSKVFKFDNPRLW